MERVVAKTKSINTRAWGAGRVNRQQQQSQDGKKGLEGQGLKDVTCSKLSHPNVRKEQRKEKIKRLRSARLPRKEKRKVSTEMSENTWREEDPGQENGRILQTL